MTERQKEESINKMALAAIIALLSWNIYTTYQLSIDAAIMKEKVYQIEQLVKVRGAR